MLRFSNQMRLSPAGRSGDHIWYGSANCASVDLASADADAALRALSGSFAIVAETVDAVLLAADFVRSIPVIWTVAGGEIAVSDDGLALAKRFGLEMDPVAREEYRHTAYTIGTRTLFKGLYATLPGELVRISKQDGAVTRRFYWDFCYTFDAEESLPELIAEFDDCLMQVFRDLIVRLNGRTALIPLSGGCDSRIIAVTLKRLGYENVVCFSYGRAGNSESNTSRKIAKALGYAWEFVEYNAEVWSEMYASDAYAPYLLYANCACSTCGFRSLPVMMKLLDKYKDSVVIPGHALDFNMGSHIPASWREDQAIDRDAFANDILHKHYNLARYPERCDIGPWKDCLPEQMSLREAVREFQRFEWFNRQSKFIANDMRKYEFLGYAGVELPFWDRRVCDFSARLPVNLLQGRRFQYHYMMEKIDPIAGIHQDYFTPPPRNNARRKALQRIRSLPGGKKAVQLFHCLHMRKHSPMACFDHLSLREYLGWMRTVGLSFNLYPISVWDALQTIDREFSK